MEYNEDVSVAKLVMVLKEFEANDKYYVKKSGKKETILKWKKSKTFPGKEATVKVKVESNDFNGKGKLLYQLNEDLEGSSKLTATLYLLGEDGNPISSTQIVSVGI